jgi:hypothetical protein
MLFEKTIFDNRKSVNQREFFEYAHITLPLLMNPKLSIKIWEQTVKYMNDAYDRSGLRDSDLE